MHRPIIAVAVFVCTLVVVGYFGISGLVADALSRPERNPLWGTPDQLGLAYEPVEFRSLVDDIPLRGWWIRSPGSERAVITVHGRNSNRTATDGLLLRQAEDLVGAGYHVLTFDTRAHGRSGGSRYSLGDLERRDVGAAIDYAHSRGIAAGRIGLLCHSMGAAACLLSGPAQPEVGAIVSDSAFARLTDLLEEELPEESGLPAVFNPGILLMGDLLYGIDLRDVAPVQAVDDIRPRPILFIHSTADQLVPVEHAYRLWDASGQGPERLWLLDGPAHGRAYWAQPREYMRRVTALFSRSLGPTTGSN